MAQIVSTHTIATHALNEAWRAGYASALRDIAEDDARDGTEVALQNLADRMADKGKAATDALALRPFG